MEIKFTDTQMADQLMALFADVYQHELCSPELKTYMRLRLTWMFGPDTDIKGSLER